MATAPYLREITACVEERATPMVREKTVLVTNARGVDDVCK
jgi:hypothetical protein